MLQGVYLITHDSQLGSSYYLHYEEGFIYVQSLGLPEKVALSVQSMLPAAELKRMILTLLKEDEEFRYAIAGLIGIEEVVRSLREMQRTLIDHGRTIESLQSTVAEHTKAIESHTKAIELLQKTIIDHSKAIESLQKVLVDHGRAIESLQRTVMEQGRTIELLQKTIIDHGKTIELLQKAIIDHGKAIESLQRTVAHQGEAIRNLARTVAAIGRRYGVVTEEAFREAVKYLIEDLLKTYTVRRWIYYDSDGIVYERPSIVEVDVLIKDQEHVLVEYKAHAGKSDVAELHRIGILYNKVVNVKPKLLLVAATIDKEALELSRELGMEVRSGEVM